MIGRLLCFLGRHQWRVVNCRYHWDGKAGAGEPRRVDTRTDLHNCARPGCLATRERTIRVGPMRVNPGDTLT